MVALRIVGTLMLALAGFGTGWLAAAGIREQREQLYRFRSFLQWLLTEIQYRSQPAAALLAQACQNNEYRILGFPSICSRFDELPVPQGYTPALRAEIRDMLSELSVAPRAVGCTGLRRVLDLCRNEETHMQERETLACRLYPRLGGCLGLLAAILLL